MSDAPEVVLYSWDVPCGTTSASGVTDSEESANSHVSRALRTGASGARGHIREVVLAPDGSPQYVELRTVSEAWLDETAGSVVFVGLRWPRQRR